MAFALQYWYGVLSVSLGQDTGALVALGDSYSAVAVVGQVGCLPLGAERGKVFPNRSTLGAGGLTTGTCRHSIVPRTLGAQTRDVLVRTFLFLVEIDRDVIVIWGTGDRESAAGQGIVRLRSSRKRDKSRLVGLRH